LSDLVDFEDLELLDGGDLRAVLGQVSAHQLLEALAGLPAGLRRHLLTKLPEGDAGRIEAEVLALGPVPTAAARSAQRAVVDALCRLSRGGQVAFHDPADMMTG
jgi:flagellar motor switch protein FliG